MKPSSRLLYFILLLAVPALMAASYWQNLQRLRGEVEHAVRSRSALVGKFVAQHRDQVAVLHNLLLAHYRAAGAGPAAPLRFERHAGLDAWALATAPGAASGTLSGQGRPPQDATTQREMRAALGLEAQIRAARQFDSEVTWLYYLSAREFIYLAPRTALENFRYTPQLYQRRYWLEAMPAANPQRRLILAGPYQDLAGQGWIITFAQPVYDGDRFLGVVALDLRTDTLQQLISMDEATGETLLVSENERLMARQGGLQGEERLRPPGSQSLVAWAQSQTSDLWMSVPVVDEELWLVHRVTRAQINLAAARASLGHWVLIVLLALMSVLAFRLRELLVEVQRLTCTDPLTQVLNRRGFYDRIGTLQALAQRRSQVLALLIMDIDFFKKINDTYGHGVGDDVLKQLGGHLQRARRATDLVCRWGGEEFVAAFVLDAPQQARAAAERLRAEAQQTHIEPGHVPVTLSGGLVLMGPGEAVDAAIQRADLNLYRAKGDGRNRIVADPGTADD